MLIKILFTLAVIFGVIIFFRHKHARAPVAEQAEPEGASLSPRMVAYGLLGVLVAVSVLIFVLSK